MALKHFSPDLGIAWFVGAEESHDLQTGKEEKPAKSNQRQYVGRAPGALCERRVAGQFGAEQGDGYCTLSA